MRELVFIAGPYALRPDQRARLEHILSGTTLAASKAEEVFQRRQFIAENVARAAALGRLAVKLGLSPIVPHLHGHAGLHGSAIEADDGTARKQALECSVAQAVVCPRFWGITYDDGNLSEGCTEERDAWKGQQNRVLVERIASWSTWVDLLGEYGIEVPA